MILSRFRSSPRDRNICDLYGAIVAQARRPAFYRDYGVPDTLDGRFDLIVLHLVLLIDRVGGDDDSSRRRIGQALFDVFCRDLDANLREMGIGDLAVPKRMREFGEAFYGRQGAYLAAFAAADAAALEKALERNIFAGTETASGACRLADYAFAARRRIAGQDQNSLLRGEVGFPEPGSIAKAVSYV